MTLKPGDAVWCRDGYGWFEARSSGYNSILGWDVFYLPTGSLFELPSLRVRPRDPDKNGSDWPED